MTSRRTFLGGAVSMAFALLPAATKFADLAGSPGLLKPAGTRIVASHAASLPSFLRQAATLGPVIVLEGSPLQRLKQLTVLAERGEVATITAYVDASDRLLVDHVVRYGDLEIMSERSDGALAALVIRL